MNQVESNALQEDSSEINTADFSPSRSEERILVYEEDPPALAETGEVISRQFPACFVTLVNSFENLVEISQERDFEVVVLSLDLEAPHAVDILHQFKLKDQEPGVLVLSRSKEPKSIAQAYSIGCHKCVIKDEDWLEEIGPALRHLIRMKRLETENRRLLAKLTEANILLTEKNRRLDEFSATLAHDIRGPLGGLSMKLEYIIDKLESNSEFRFQELLKKAYDSTRRLINTVQIMYDFAKIGANAAKMEAVNLAVLVGEVLSDLHFEDSLDIKIGVDKLPVVWGNPDLLRRVFVNLVNNAVKYNDKKEIIVNIGVGGIYDRAISKFCEIYVEDNGRGIPQNELETIFGMFQRGSSSEGSDGVGIGLSVVRRIVELHFGSIRVESKLGEGSKFIIGLPTEKVGIL